MTDETQQTNNGTFYSILGGDSGVEELVRRHTWFYQPFRRARETEFLKRALRNARTEKDLHHQFTGRLQDLHHTYNSIFNSLYASWVFYNRVKCRHIMAYIRKKKN
ncbi:hypothetical protein GF371_02830 [Candidatus Woesearchaeota archaeon]|nr:hypothetical protein [Candidatus Woesearchaeota archaeon]